MRPDVRSGREQRNRSGAVLGSSLPTVLAFEAMLIARRRADLVPQRAIAAGVAVQMLGAQRP